MNQDDHTAAMLRQLEQEASGGTDSAVFEIEIHDVSRAILLIAGAMCGDPAAVRTFNRLNSYFKQLDEREPDNRPTCLICDAEIPGLPRMVALFGAANPVATVSLAASICEVCGELPGPEIEAGAVRGYQAQFPDARRLDISTQVGRA